MAGSVSLVRAGSAVAPLLWARRGVECCSQSLSPQCLSRGAPPPPVVGESRPPGSGSGLTHSGGHGGTSSLCETREPREVRASTPSLWRARSRLALPVRGFQRAVSALSR